MASASEPEAERFLADAAPTGVAAPGRAWRPGRVWLGAAALSCGCLALAALGRPRAALRAAVAGPSEPSGLSGISGLSEKRGGRPKRRGSFLVIGDWGYDPRVHGNVMSVSCQQTVADKMLETMRSLGDVEFIINVGDSFYPDGVSGKDDPQWESKWRKIFHPELRSVPWYSVYGNHDYHKDPCACESDPHKCAQVNDDITNTKYFYMPSYNWNRHHEKFKLEVVGLDLNQFVWAWDRKAPLKKQCAEDCFYTACHHRCEGNMVYRSREALSLLRERLEHSTAETLVVFSHYPTDYLWQLPKTMRGLSNESRRVVYFGGHRHNVDQNSTASTAPNSNWLVGGGGGWSCDPIKGEDPRQGFVVGEIGADYRLTTRAVLVDPAACCPPPPTEPAPQPPGPPPGYIPPKPFCANPIWVPSGF